MQRALFPSFVLPNSELICQFGDWHERVLTSYRHELTPDQAASLAMLDQHMMQNLEELSREVDTDPAQLASHQYWHISRVLAKEALRHFGWAHEPPPRHDDEFEKW